MPVQFAETFQPVTDFGRQLNGFVTSLFSGSAPYDFEARQALAADRKAQERYHNAQAAKVRAETLGLEEQNRELYNRPVEWVSAMTGLPQDRVRSVQRYLVSGDAMPSSRSSVPPSGGSGPLPSDGLPEDTLVAPPVEVVGLSPDDIARVSRALAVYSDRAATRPNDPHSVARAYRENIRSYAEEPLMFGMADKDEAVRRIAMALAAADGKPLYHAGKEGVLNQYTGLLDALPGDQQGDEWVEVNVMGRKELVRRSDLSKQAAEARYRAPPRPDKPEKPEKPERIDASEMNSALKGFSEGVDRIEEDHGGAFKAEDRARLISRATQLYKDPQSGYFRDRAGAFEAATAELGYEIKERNWFSKNELGLKSPPAPAKPAPGDQLRPPKPVPPAQMPRAKWYVSKKGKRYSAADVQKAADREKMSFEDVVLDLGLSPGD